MAIFPAVDFVGLTIGIAYVSLRYGFIFTSASSKSPHRSHKSSIFGYNRIFLSFYQHFWNRTDDACIQLSLEGKSARLAKDQNCFTARPRQPVS